MDKKEALKQVLDERAMAYENCYDYKFHTDWKWTQREIFENFKQDFQIYTN
jgi:shikimate kinase